jgi:beta-lactam-binding protein with PASTA domain
MLLALGAIVLVAIGILVAYLLTHRNKHHPAATTIVVTTTPSTTVGGRVNVPDVRGMKATQAASTLRSLGFTATQQRVAVSDAPAGTVVTESPTPGTLLAKGSQVLLSVAQPKTPTTTTTATTTATTTPTSTPTTTAAAPPQPASATVPDLSGKDEAGAAQALYQANLLASIVFVPSQDPLGTVEGQAKAAGTTVPSRSHVQVNVSKGPGQKPDETVPNVDGKTLQDALAAIKGANLRLIYLKYPVTNKAQAGKIVQQSPLGGAHAPQNAQVLVYLGAFKG